MLTVADLFPERSAAAEPDVSAGFARLSNVRDAAEQRQIQRTLDETGGRMAEAARLLGVSRSTLWEKAHPLGLD